MYINKSERIFLQILLITAVSIISGGQIFTVAPDKDTTINIINSQSGCKVCDVTSIFHRCNNHLEIKPNTKVKIDFRCHNPQVYFRVEIVHKIACTSKSCDPIIQSDFESRGLSNFNRTFIWMFKPGSQNSFQINFTKTGLRQIAPTDSCPDKNIYTLRAANVLLGKYCLSGTISSATVQGKGNFSLDIPAGQNPSSGQFDVSEVEKITTIAKISVTLQEGSLTSTLLTPNYPDSFPDDDEMEWYFQVPNKHKAAIKFLNLKKPSCSKKETAVEYRSKGRNTQLFSLDKVQPEQNQGSFSLRLRNCEMDTRRSDSKVLSMKIIVSASRGPPLMTILGVVAALVVIFIIVLVVVCIVIKKKKRELSTEVSVYNPGNTNVQPGPNTGQEECENDYHMYNTIDESLVYTHLLQGQRDGVYDVYESYEFNTELERKTILDKVGDDSISQSQRGRNSYIELIVDSSIYDPMQQNKKEDPPTLQPREPKGSD